VVLKHADDVGIFVGPDFAVTSNGDNLVDHEEAKSKVDFQRHAGQIAVRAAQLALAASNCDGCCCQLTDCSESLSPNARAAEPI
jgi:hypothetical protein